MKREELKMHFQGPMMVTTMVIVLVFLLGQPDIPVYLQGPMATIAVVVLSIVTRYGLFDTTQNSGSDLAFCSVGLQLAFFYKKIEQPISPLSSLFGWDVIFLICSLIGWMVCLILIKKAQNARARLRYINPYSLCAGILGFLSVLLQIYWRLLCQL